VARGRERSEAASTFGDQALVPDIETNLGGGNVASFYLS
jgi:hypothetical protein